MAYFDAIDIHPVNEQSHRARLTTANSRFLWEVMNQATVHRWFDQHFGYAVPALKSLEEAIATWPEYATSVGVARNAG